MNIRISLPFSALKPIPTEFVPMGGVALPAAFSPAGISGFTAMTAVRRHPFYRPGGFPTSRNIAGGEGSANGDAAAPHLNATFSGGRIYVGCAGSGPASVSGGGGDGGSDDIDAIVGYESLAFRGDRSLCAENIRIF